MKRNVINWIMLSAVGLVGVYWFLTSGDNALHWLEAVNLFGMN